MEKKYRTSHVQKLSWTLSNFAHIGTHLLAAAIGLMFASAFIHTWLTIPVFAIGLLAGLLPDIDTGTSWIGRRLPPLSRWIERHLGHRREIHTIWPPLAFWAAGNFLYPPLEPYADAATIGYLSHLAVDTFNPEGIAPFLPLSNIRITLLGAPIQRKHSSEITLLVILAAITAFGAAFVQFEPSEFIHRLLPTIDTAREQYREWEGLYEVYADVQGTWNTTHQRYTGHVRISGLDPSGALILQDITTGQTFTAGKHPIDTLYVSRITLSKGDPITTNSNAPPATSNAPPPAPTPTPHLLAIRIPHVYALNSEILVRAGDTITPGQLLADLATYRALIATPTPAPTWTPQPTPTPTGPDPLAVQLAETSVTAARARLQKARNNLRISQDHLDFLNSFLANGWDNVDWDELAYWIPGPTSGPKGKRMDVPLHRALASAKLNVEQDTLDVQIAQAELSAALARQTALSVVEGLATPTPAPPHPVTVSPPHPVTPDPLAVQPDPTLIYSLVAGRVVAVNIAAITGNEATAEIIVHVTAAESPH